MLPVVLGTATLVFLVLQTAVTLGAAWWRYQAEVAAWPGLQAAVDTWTKVASTLRSANGVDWTGEGSGYGPPAPDLDLAAAAAQVVAGTAAFAVVLSVALLLASRRQRALAVLAAITAGASVASLGGVLAWTAPMVPVAANLDPASLRLDDYPAALVAPRIAMMRALGATDTPAWWAWTLGVAVALIALVAVAIAVRGCAPVETIPGRPRPGWPGLLVAAGGLLVALVFVVDGDPSTRLTPALLGVTVLLVLTVAAAAASERAAIAWYLALGLLGVHALLYVAFNRDGGAPGGWGVGSGGPQAHATTMTFVLLVAAPLAGWALASAWVLLGRLQRHDERATGAVTPA